MRCGPCLKDMSRKKKKLSLNTDLEGDGPRGLLHKESDFFF